MKFLKQLSLFLSPIGALLIISLLWIFAIKPQLNKFILSKIAEVNRQQPYVEIKLKSFDLSLLKLQVLLNEIEVTILKPEGLGVPLKINRVIAQLDPFRLIVGQVGLSQVQINQFDWHYINTSTSSDPLKEIPTQLVFKWLPEIPVDQVVIQNSNFKYTDVPLDLDVQVMASWISLRNFKSALGLDAKRIYTTIKKQQNSEIQFELNHTARLNYDKKGSTLKIDLFEVKNINSQIQLRGQIDQFEKSPSVLKGQLKIQSQIQLDDLRTMLLAFQQSKTRIPSLTGSIKNQGELQLNGFSNINGNFSLETENVSVDHFKLGQAKVLAEVKKNQLFINQIQVEHPAGQAQLKQIEIEQSEPFSFKARLNLQSIDLQKLFISIGLKDIPAGLKAQGDAFCQGVVKPQFKATCETRSQISDIWVKSDIKAESHILKIKKAAADGRIDFTESGLDYKTKLTVGTSEGTSQGSVSFADGFKIQFETAKLKFEDVESLADLNFKGDLKIKGSTQGGTSWGVIDSVIHFTNAEIDSFRLDQLTAQLKYEKSALSLSEIDGTLGKSTYKGGFRINFSESEINGNIKIPDLHGQDLFFALGKRFNLPFELSGRGQAEVNFLGPLQFWKMQYSLRSILNRGLLAGEGFEQIQVDLNSTGNEIQFKEVALRKNRGRLNLAGFIDTSSANPDFKLTLKASPLYLEEIDHLIKLTPAITGQAWLDGKVTGPLEHPEVQFNFSAKQVNLDSKDYPSSQGQVRLDSKYFKFSGQLFGRQVQADLLWPWKQQDPYALKVQVRDLDPLMFLPLISVPQPTSEYYGRINADIDLKAPRREIRTSDGTIKINDFMLQRGALYLKLLKPTVLNYRTGLKQMDPIELRGESNSLSITLDQVLPEEIRLQVGSDLQLRLFQFLVPFAQSLSGRLLAETSVKIRSDSFELFGDGELNDGLVGFKGFPQPIDNINAPIQFSKSKIILSDIFAQLGQSEILGQGQIDIRGSRQIAVNLQAATDNLELNFPDKVLTYGRADIAFKGNWLPYTLKVDYKVSRGLVESNFDETDPNSRITLKSSPYLPQKQTEEKTASLLLDADIDLTQGVIVKNKLMEGEVFGRLKVGGSPEQPEILGRIDIRPGSKLIFKDKPFDIQTASIQFNDPSVINPDIFMSAQARVSEYDINLLVQGPAKSLSIQPTSQPPLSKEDIFSLLALGLTSSKLDQTISSDAQQQQTGLEVLAAIGNQSEINKRIQQKLGLTVQLAPTIDTTKNIAVPKVVVSRNFRKNINASYSRPITGDNPVQEWKLQYLFNPNKSVILNYQSTESNQQDKTQNNNNNNDAGILGLDFEYKKEFKW